MVIKRSLGRSLTRFVKKRRKPSKVKLYQRGGTIKVSKPDYSSSYWRN